MSTRYALSKANQADDLFGYNFDATNLRSLQLELLQNYRLSTEARAEISTELGRRFDTMCQAAMKLLTAQCACAACGECPLVIGSRHEAMPVRTLKLFMQLTTQITNIKGQLVNVPAEVIAELKDMFEEVIKSYKEHNVAATCSGLAAPIAQARHATLEDGGVRKGSRASVKADGSVVFENLEGA